METLDILSIGGLVPWHPNVGGGHVIAYKISEAIAKLGHSVTYLAIAPKEYQRDINWGLINYSENDNFLPQFSHSLKNEINNFDAVYIHNWGKLLGHGLGLTLGKIFKKNQGAKIGLGVYSPKIYQIPRSLNEVFWRITIKKVDLIFALSDFSKKDINEIYGVPNSKIKITYAGVDESFFIGKKNKRSNIPFSLLFCGRLNGKRQQKGVDVLLKSMPLILKEHDVVLEIIGKGSREQEYKHLTKNLGIDEYVNFLGFIDPERLPEFYSKADLFVLPSRRESFGLVLAEAMAAGLPVVSTNVGAIPEVVKDGKTGLLVPPNNPEKFAQTVNSLLSDRNRMRAMGLKGTERAREHFTWDKVAKNVLKGYEEI